MTSLENELRWERIWNLACLDAISLYRQELNVEVDSKQIQLLIRPILDEHYLKHGYTLAAGRLNCLAISALRANMREDEQRQFYLWGDRVLSLGSRRTAEFFWLSVVQDREEVRKPIWIEDVFANIRSAMERPNEGLMSKIQMLSAQLSIRDRSILNRIDMSEESLATCFSLTAFYNIFTCVWRIAAKHLSIEQLDEIHLIGKELAARRNVPETVLCFPGTWDFGLFLQCPKLNAL